MAKQIDIKVKYTPDTSALKGALKDLRDIDIKVGGNGDLKKELSAPIQSAVKDINKALASGASNKELLSLYKNLGNEAEKASKKVSSMLTRINSNYTSTGNQDMLKQIKEYDDQLNKLEKKYKAWNDSYGNKAISNLRDKAEVKSSDEARKLKKELELSKELTEQDKQRVEAINKYLDALDKRRRLQKEGTTATKFEEDRRDIIAKRNDLIANSQSSKDNSVLNEELNAYRSILNSFDNISTKGVDGFTKALGVQQEQAKKGRKEFLKFGDVLGANILGTSISHMFEDGISRGIAFFKEYDGILTRTSMVTGMARDEVNSLTSSYNKLANQLSSTTKDVAKAQLVFYQQGLSTSDALKMTEASIAISKTGGIEAGEAANRLTAAVRGYKLAESEAMNIADKMSALDAAAASSVDELTIAMQKSASQARMAGLDLDYYMAYLSTMQEVTREAPENIGTAMKSITSRLQEIRDIGKIEEDGTTFSNVAKALNSVGIAAVDSAGQIRDLQSIMNELGPMWKELDRNHQAYIATTLAGNRQQSRFIALMDNYDRALELVEISQNAEGESARQLRAYQQGLEASLTSLNNAWQQAATKVANSDMIKGIVDGITNLIELFNKLPDSITKVILPLTLFYNVFKAFNADGEKFSIVIGDLFKGEFRNPFSILTDGIKKFGTTLLGVKGSITGFFSSFNNKKIDETAKSLETLGEVTDINTAAQARNTAVKKSDDAVDSQEVAENEVIERSQITMKTAYDSATDSVERQKNAMQADFRAKTEEVDRAIREAEGEKNRVLEENKVLKKQYDKELKDLKIDYKKLDRAHKEYLKPESYSSGGLMYEQAMDDYFKDNPNNIHQFSFNFDTGRYNLPENFDEYLKKAEKSINVGYYEERMKLLDKMDAIDIKKDMVEQSDIDIQYKYNKTLDDLYRRKKKLMDEFGGVELEEPKKLTGKDFLNDIRSKSKIEFGEVKQLFSDEGVKKTEAFGAILGKVNIAGGLAAASIASIATSLLGLEEDESSAINLGAGLMTALAPIMPPAGLIAGATIAGIAYAFDKMYVSADEARKSLEQINEEQDALATKSSSIKGALETYNELYNKIDKSEEEQQELNDAANELAKIIPTAVRGYDSMGNAIINVAAVQAELNSIMSQGVDLAKREMKSLNDLQEANDGWDFTRWLAEGLPWNWGNGKTAAEKQKEDRVNTAKEYQADIADYFTTIRDSLTQQMDDTEKEIFNRISGTFASSLSEKVFALDDTNISIEQMMTEYQSLLDSLANNIDMNQLEDKIQRLEFAFEFGDDTLEQAADRVRREVEAMLSAAGYNTEEIDQVVNVILDITMDGAGDVVGMLENIKKQRRAIQQIRPEDRTEADNRELENLNYMEEQIKGLDTETASFANKLGLLNVSMAEFIKSQGGIKNITDGFKDANGQFDKTKTTLDDLNAAYAKLDELEEKREKLQNQMNNGEFTFSGKSPSLKDMDNMIKEHSSELINPGDYKTYSLAISNLMSKGFNKSMSDEELKDMSGVYGLSKAHIEDIRKMYKIIANGNSDQARGLAEVNGLLKVQKNLIDNITNEYPEEPTFGEMSESIDKSIEKCEKLVGLLEEIRENGGKMSMSNVSSMFSVLNTLQKSFDEKSNFLDISAWNENIGKIEDGFKVVNGELTLNKEGQQALIDLQYLEVQAQWQAQLAELEKTEAQIENRKAVMVAYRDSLKTMLENIEREGEAQYNENKSEMDMANTLGEYLDKQNWAQVKSTESSLNEQLKLYQSFFTQIDKMKTDFEEGKPITFDNIKADDSTLYKNIMDPIKARYEGLLTDNYKDTVANLKAEIQNVDKTIEGLDAQLNGIAVKKRLANYLANNKDLVGKLGEGAKNAADNQDEYNEKLERTLTLLEKIAGLQHTIDENETFKSLYKEYNGEDYGRLLMTNLDLAQQQYDVYKDLFDMQQQMTNQAAGDLLDSPYGEMFKIQKNGNIGWADLSMYDKYKNLPDDMQEDIDNLVEAFQKQRDALRSTEKDLAKYAQEVKKVREELVEMEIYIENELVNAIKNREKILHDARMKALDDEVKMIEEAVEKRKKARETESQNKELYQAQEALRRATLDSSGKNNAQLLQLQQELEDKQLEIAEKRFEDDMEDRKQWLQDTKDAETETYEYRLETMTWYWEQVQEIQEAGTEAMMEALIHWNEEYNKQSELQQREMARKWKETMDAMKAATDMGAELGKLTADIGNVTKSVEAMNIEVSKLPGLWDAAAKAKSRYAGTSSGGGYSSNVSGGKGSGTGGGNGGNSSNSNKNVYEEVAGPPKSGDNIVLQQSYTCPEPGSSVDMNTSYKFGGETFYKVDGQNAFVTEDGISEWKLLKRYGNYTAAATGSASAAILAAMKNTNKRYAKGVMVDYTAAAMGSAGAAILAAMKNTNKRYAKGGMVDYTGPAWVDGTKTHPEAFLNPYQTESIASLAESLSNKDVANVTGDTSVTFGSINFNVASMSSAADGKKALEIFVQGANDLMSKKGIGTKLNMNVK